MSTVINNNITQTIPFFTQTGVSRTLPYTSTVTGYTGIPLTFFVPTSSYRSSQFITPPTWVFSDGTFERGLTASKVFQLPGSYSTTLVIHTSAGNIALSPVSQNINIRNYVDDALVFDTDVRTLSSSGIVAGRYSERIDIRRINSWQSYTAVRGNYILSLECSNSKSPELDSEEFFNEKWSHLYPSWRFYNDLSILTPIKSVSTTNTEIWVFYDGVSTFETTSDGEYTLNGVDLVPYFVGSSGIGSIYFIDDTPNLQNKLFFKNDNRIVTNQEILFRQTIPDLELPIYNTGTLVLPLPITSNTPTQLFFTAYGLSGIDYDPEYYTNCYNTLFIGFGDSEGYTVKGFNTVYLSVNGGILTPSVTSIYDPNNSVNFALTNLGNDTYKSSLSSGIGIKLKLNGNTSSVNTTIQVSVTGVSGGTNFTFTGSGITVYVSPSGQGRFPIRKRGEEVSLIDNVKAYRQQPNLFKMEVLFDTVLGTLLGNQNSTTDTFGKVVYEKIENFTNNVADIDTANISSLYSLLSSINFKTQTYDYNFTGELQRVVDLLSIKPSRLKGSLQHNSNFYQNTTDHFGGLNLGEELNFYTDYISAGTEIIINQFYNNVFKRVLVFCQPLTGLLTPPPLSGFYTGSYLLSTYPLSCYQSSTFGWGISGDVQDIVSNYRFYKFVPVLTPSSSYQYSINDELPYPFNTFTLDATNLDPLSGYSKGLLLRDIFKSEIINWKDPNNSFLFNNISSVSAWWDDNMYVNSLIDYNLKKGLGLLS